jgi:CheY-like chemotaxis protein
MKTSESSGKKQDRMSIRVSIVEDNGRVRGSLARLITLTDGFECVSEHGSGEEAVAALPKLKPEVILMDINLPGISGLEALRILQADPATAHIPVIALSANAVPRDVHKGLSAGFFQYITKPIKVQQLLDALDAALALPDASRGPAAPKEPA